MQLVYSSSRSPPPLQHPRPQHPPSQIPSTSPPPPDVFSNDAASYQRFSSPPVHAQQAYAYGATGRGRTGHVDPDAYIPAGQSHGYAVPHQQPGGNSGGFMGSMGGPSSGMRAQQQGAGGSTVEAGGGGLSWLGSGGGAGGNGAMGDGTWPGMNDATAQMGVQFGKHAFDAGQAYIDKNFTRLLPLAHLKHSFNVSNGYVLLKLRLVLWPWRHKPWSRSLRRSETSGVAEGWKPPREDINCPDLYIPVMSVVTYILLAAVIAGSQGLFDPRILGQTASKAIGVLFLEFLVLKIGCYLLGIGGEGAVVDLLAYEGYKFIGVILTLVAGLLGAKGWMYWGVFFYLFLATFFFLLRSLRHIVLPDPALSPLDHSASPATTASSISHSSRNMRIRFLFFIAAAQGLSMGLLVRV